MDSCIGISFIDSACLKVYRIKRKYSNHVFKGIATKGKSTMGWFFGFKLHIIINDRGEIISFVITQGNVDDRQPLSMESFIRNIFGRLYVDRGYVSRRLSEILFVDSIHFVAKMRNNMKGGELLLYNRLMLCKRFVIESVNFITNLIAGLLSYSFLPKKPSIRVDFFDDAAYIILILYRIHIK
jgi:hypothetical protein